MDQEQIDKLFIDLEMFLGKLQEKFPTFKLSCEFSAVGMEGFEINTESPISLVKNLQKFA